MGIEVIVLRPFVFTFPPKSKAQKLVTEYPVTPRQDPTTKVWIPTTIELPDEIAAHPWIAEQFADGRIERPEHTAARLKAANDIKAKEAEEHKRILAQAEAALARTAAVTARVAASDEEVNKELDTPLDQLQRQQGGADLDKTVTELQQESLAGGAEDNKAKGKPKGK